jgi:integrase
MTLTEVILGGTKRFRFAPALSPDTSLLGPLRSRIARARISPHTMRHTKAMHLLQSGVPLVMVKDFLGHVDLKSTEVYVHADLEMKRKSPRPEWRTAGNPTATSAPFRESHRMAGVFVTRIM